MIKPGGCLPVIENHFSTWLEKYGKLAAFGTQPHAVFASIGIDVRSPYRRIKRLVIDPAKTASAEPHGCTGKHFALVSGRYNYLRITIGQNNYTVLRLQKLKVVTKCSLFKFHFLFPFLVRILIT